MNQIKPTNSEQALLSRIPGFDEPKKTDYLVIGNGFGIREACQLVGISATQCDALAR